jgi:hypothetical protein
MNATCYLCSDEFETTAENVAAADAICPPCYLRINGGGYMLHTRPGQACYCPICHRWMSGRERSEHMQRHTEQDTARRIETELGVTLDDFVGYCIQNGFDIDGRSPDDPLIEQAIQFWKVGGDACSDEEYVAIFGEDEDEDQDQA